MKTTVYKKFLAMCVFGASVMGANGQILPAAAAITGHTVTVNSAAAYLELEHSINTLGEQLREAFVDHPNLQFRPAYDANGEILCYLVTGAGSAKEASKISQLLMELDVLGGIANSVDPQYLPMAKADRISKHDAQN